MNNKKGPVSIAVLLLAAAFFIYTFYDFITSPATIIMQMDGDGVKNYFTFLYHCLYEKGVWFHGMNYPYGENVVFTDGQPFLSVPISYLSSVLHFSTETLLTIMHLLITASFVVAMVYVHKILRLFNVEQPLAIFFSALIILLSPQIFRLTGHFALSYCCVVPMVFYWLIQYHITNKLKYALYLYLIGAVAVFAHPYFLAMLMLWVGFYSVGYFLFTRNSIKQKVLHISPVLLSFAGVFATFKLYLIATDPIKDRPTFPWGFLDACSSPGQVLTSTRSPIWGLLKGKPIYEKLNNGGEGNAYLGLVVIVVCSIFLVLAIKNLVGRKQDPVVGANRFSFIWLFIAFCTFAFSMGYPFVLNNMGWLLGKLSVIKQFRSLGRFSWVFYYIMTVYAVLCIDSVFKQLMQSNRKTLATAFVTLAMGIWTIEAFGYSSFLKGKTNEALDNYKVFFSKNEQTWPQYLKEKKYKPEDFQAILLLPYFHVGTEKLWVSDLATDWILTFGLRASLQLHLPVVDVMMSRSSWSQAMAQVKLIAGPFSEKAILGKDHRPFLILHHDAKAPLDQDSRYLFDASEKVGEFNHFQVYACYPDRIAVNDKRYNDSASAIAEKMPSGDTCIGCTGAYYYEHLDAVRINDVLFGNGACKAKAEYDSTFLKLDMKPMTADSVEYEFSVWSLVNDIDFTSPNFELKLLDANDNLLNSVMIKSTSSIDNYKMWFRASKYFMVPKSCTKITAKVIDWGFYSMDEVLLRPARSLVISKDDSGRVMFNNHLFDKK